MKRIIGITGGIASGKSTVCSVIRSQGYPVIDCDRISYELSQKGQPLYNAIIEKFGSSFLKENEELDRAKLGKLIFNNETAKLVLNSISHPLIKEELLKQIAKYDNGLIFIEVPLLYESKFDDICDRVICVFLPKKLQVERLMKREGIDEDYALSKIHSQMDLYLKKSLADFVIDSRGSFDETRLQVENIINNLKGV